MPGQETWLREIFTTRPDPAKSYEKNWQSDLSDEKVPPVQHFSTPTVEGGGGAAGGAGAAGAAGAAAGAWLGKQCHAQVKEDVLFWKHVLRRTTTEIPACK